MRSRFQGPMQAPGIGGTAQMNTGEETGFPAPANDSTPRPASSPRFIEVGLAYAIRA